MDKQRSSQKAEVESKKTRINEARHLAVPSKWQYQKLIKEHLLPSYLSSEVSEPSILFLTQSISYCWCILVSKQCSGSLYVRYLYFIAYFWKKCIWCRESDISLLFRDNFNGIGFRLFYMESVFNA